VSATVRAPYSCPLAEELAPDVLDRFLRYVRIDTQSAYGSDSYPSTASQLELSRLLQSELLELGAADAELTADGYVLATLPGAPQAPVVGLIAHVDTTPDTPGTGVRPVVHGAYSGGPIVLQGDPARILDPAELPELAARVGHDIVTSDGTTLLGADDKAGVAEIMSAAAHLLRNPDPPHATVRIAFTVDEEIGAGADRLDLDRFGAGFAYTLDGSGVGELEIESFSAYTVRVRIAGTAVHPGSAKGRLVNAIKLAAELVGSLPVDRLSPETTEDREGFVHPQRISGNAGETLVTFLARDHDDARLEEHVAFLRRLADDVSVREPRARVSVEVEEAYRSMGQVLAKHPEVVSAAEEAIRRAGVEPRRTIIRGGTDGARLSALGLPTPNLFTGGQDYHSVCEWASVQDMAAAAATVVELARLWAE
jgi:tripeptide aminopeptidase